MSELLFTVAGPVDVSKEHRKLNTGKSPCVFCACMCLRMEEKVNVEPKYCLVFTIPEGSCQSLEEQIYHRWQQNGS